MENSQSGDLSILLYFVHVHMSEQSKFTEEQLLQIIEFSWFFT